MRKVLLMLLFLVSCVCGTNAQTVDELINEGLKWDYPKISKKYFQPAISKGSSLAMTLYAMQHYLEYVGWPHHKKYKNYPNKTIKLLTQASQQNDFWAKPMFGFCYEQGVGVPFDYSKAFAFFSEVNNQAETKLAELGTRPFSDKCSEAKFKLIIYSQIHLAFLYENGLGTDINTNKAKSTRENVSKVLKKMIDNGRGYSVEEMIKGLSIPVSEDFVFSLYEYKLKYPIDKYSDLAESEEQIWKNWFETEKQLSETLKFEKLKKEANLGDSKAYFSLASSYQYGSGCDKNYVEALKWYWMSDPAKSSYTTLECIAKIYMKGDYGVYQNIDSAFWYYDGAIYNSKKSNVSISSDLQNNYNKCKSLCSDVVKYSYLSTKSVYELRNEAKQAYDKKNYSYAADLYEKVAIRIGEANDYYLAAESLDIAENYINSLPLYEKAAQLGHSKAKSELPRMTYNVGWSYYKSKNYSEALKYYKKASDMGYADAANNIGVMYKKGEGVSANNFSALTWYQKAMNMGSSTGKDNYYSLKRIMETPQQTVQQEQQNDDKYEKIGNAISEIGEGLSQIFGGGTTNNNYNNNNYSSGSYNNNSSNSSGGGSHYSEQKCSFCGGSGKCSGTSNTVSGRNQSCNGSGKCFKCGGSRISYDNGTTQPCTVCRGSGKCTTCNGTGNCKKCGGKGKIMVRN